MTRTAESELNSESESVILAGVGVEVGVGKSIFRLRLSLLTRAGWHLLVDERLSFFGAKER